MIELIALVALIAVFGLVVFGIVKAVSHHKKKQQKEFDAWMKETDERARKMREAERERQEQVRQALANTKPNSYHKTTVTKNAGMPARVRTTSSTAPADTWSNDLLTTMVIADTISDAISALSSHSSSPSYSDSSSSSNSSSSSSYSSSPSYSDSSSSSSSYSDSDSSSSSSD